MRIGEALGGIYLRSLYHLFRLQHSNFTRSFVGVVARCSSYLRSLPKIGYALEPGLSKSFLNVKVPSLSFGTCSTFPFLTSRSSSYCHVFRVVFFFLLPMKQPSGRSSFVAGVESLMAKLVVIRIQGLKRPARTPLELGRARLNFHLAEVRRLVFFCSG